jgi:hypothetical protein
VRRAALALLLAACPGGETRVSSASYAVDGALRESRSVDDRGGARVTCTVDRDPSDPLDTRPVFTLAIVEASDGREGTGLYLTARGFGGAATYDGAGLFYAGTTVEACADPAEARCFVADAGCSLILERWELGDLVAPGVKNGGAAGRFDCAALAGGAGDETVRVSSGSFSCRASDWTAAR